MDIPISMLTPGKMFLPEHYKVKDFGGDVIAANRVPAAFREEAAVRDLRSSAADEVSNLRMDVLPGQIGGYVTDPTGAVIANARITLTSSDNGISRTAASDASGRWIIAGLPSGNYKINAESAGFRTIVYDVHSDSNQPAAYNFPLNVGNVSTTVEVTAATPMVNTESVSTLSSLPLNGRNYEKLPQLAPGAVSQNASANVLNLQKRVAGVLPVAIDVPRAGTSFSFVRPLVLDEETKVTFSYKSR